MLKFLARWFVLLFHACEYKLIEEKKVHLNLCDSDILNDPSLYGVVIHHKCQICDSDDYRLTTAQEGHFLDKNKFRYWMYKDDCC